MTTAATQRANLVGAGYALATVTCFSVNDVGIKFLSGDHALHQVVFIRAVVALVVFTCLVTPLGGRLAALPISDATALFFVSPLVITVFFLRETVGPRRCAAIAVGFIGLMVIVKPGNAAFQPASLSAPWLVCTSMEYQNGQPLPGRAPAGAHAPPSSKFRDLKVRVPADRTTASTRCAELLVQNGTMGADRSDAVTRPKFANPAHCAGRPSVFSFEEKGRA